MLDRITESQRCLYCNSNNLWIYYLTLWNGIKVAIKIKVDKQSTLKTLKLGDILYYVDGPNAILWVLRIRRGCRTLGRNMCDEQNSTEVEDGWMSPYVKKSDTSRYWKQPSGTDSKKHKRLYSYHCKEVNLANNKNNQAKNYILNTSERNKTCCHLDFILVIPILDFRTIEL